MVAVRAAAPRPRLDRVEARRTPPPPPKPERLGLARGTDAPNRPSSGGAVAKRGDLGLASAHLSRQLADRVDNRKSCSPSAVETPPTPEALKERLDRFVEAGQHPALSEDQRNAIDRLSDDERRMYGKTLDELERFRDGKIDQAQYMTNVMQHAADIAVDDGNKFVALTGMAFSESGGSGGSNFQRGLAGAGPHEAGSILERINQSLAKERGGSDAAAGFNPNILDTNPDSTVTHHFGEFLQAGANRWDWIARAAQDRIDSKDANPGDVRNGYFAIMLGDAVSDGKLSPNDAVALTRWAFTNKDDAAAPPWGTEDGGRSSHLEGGDYGVDRWVEAFNAAHPGAPIELK